MLDIAIELATLSVEIELQMCFSGLDVEEWEKIESTNCIYVTKQKGKTIQNTQTNPQSECAYRCGLTGYYGRDTQYPACGKKM